MMRRTVSVLFVVWMLVVALPVLAQQPPAGGERPGGDRPREGMRMMMGNMMQTPPVMMIAEGKIYVIYMGQLSLFDANTLTCIKTVPLPMPQMMPMGPGPGGPPPGGLPPGAGAPPPAPQ